MDSTRKKAIEDDITQSSRKGGLFFYVDTAKLERLGIEQYKPSLGANFIRIIAPQSTGFFRRKVWIHTNADVNNRTVLCLRKTYEEPCPICEYREDLKNKNPEDERISELYPGRRYLLFVYDVESKETEEKGLRWFDCPPSLFEEIVKLSKDKRTGEIIDVSDPRDGRDIEFVQAKVADRISYESIKLVSVQETPKEWHQDVPEYDTVLLKTFYDKMKEGITGITARTSETSSKSDTEEPREAEATRESSSERKSRGESRNRSRSEEQSVPVDLSVKDRIDEIRNRREREE